MKRTMIVGDIGINHNGDVDIALELIKQAAVLGFDAVKFQKRNPELYPETPKDSAILGQCTYREHKRALELWKDDYDKIDDQCKAYAIDWFASCWDIESVDFIAQYQPKYWKIASQSITDLELVEYIAKQDGHVIMSLGMCTQDEMWQATELVAEWPPTAILLHCTAEYPTPPEHANLNRLLRMRKMAGFQYIGYSSHDGNPFTPSVAVALGAEVVEVHITLDRTLPGSDHAASLGPPGMRVLVERIRTVEKIMGSSEKQFYPAEREKRESMKQVNSCEHEWEYEAKQLDNLAKGMMVCRKCGIQGGSFPEAGTVIRNE